MKFFFFFAYRKSLSRPLSVFKLFFHSQLLESLVRNWGISYSLLFDLQLIKRGSKTSFSQNVSWYRGGAHFEFYLIDVAYFLSYKILSHMKIVADRDY